MNNLGNGVNGGNGPIIVHELLNGWDEWDLPLLWVDHQNVRPEQLVPYPAYPAHACLNRSFSQNSLDESSQRERECAKPKENKDAPYKDGNHFQRVFQVFHSMRKMKELCDVTLIAEEIRVHAHRVVLAGSSPYFHAMFNNFEERTKESVTLYGIDGKSLELLVDFMYTAEISVTEENVQCLLSASNLLQLTAVTEACCFFLENQIHPTNCLGLRAFAQLHNCENLATRANAYIEQHFEELVKEEEFFNLSLSDLLELLKNDKLVIISEETVYECVMDWIRHDEKNRAQHTAALLEVVRLPLVGKEFLCYRVKTESLIADDAQCVRLLLDALEYHVLKDEPSFQRRKETMRVIPRHSNRPKVLIMIGGQAPKAIRSVECMDLTNNKWYTSPDLCDLSSRRCRAGAVTFNDKVFLIGGFNGSQRVRTVEIYDPYTHIWSPGPSMEVKRSTLGVAVINDGIYAVGGFDGVMGLDSAEVLYPGVNKWTPLKPMSVRRSSVGVGVLNNALYAVGGYDRISRECLRSVECYDPYEEKWRKIPDMISRRSGVGVGVLKNILYAVGGHDGPLVQNTVECYDPLTDTWTPVAPLNMSRRNASVISHDGYLYAIGGDDGRVNLPSVEVYSPEKDTWTLLVYEMNIGRSYAAVAIIHKVTKKQN